MFWVFRNPLYSLKKAVKETNWRYYAVRCLITVGADDRALRLIEKQLDAGDDPTLHLEAGKLYLKKGRLEKAAWHHRQARVAGSEDFTGWLESYYGDDGTAVPRRERRWAFCALGNWYLVSGNPEKALAYYDRAIVLGLRGASVVNNKALCLLQLGRYQEALLYFRKAVKSSWDPVIPANMGLTLSKLYRFEEALTYYELAQQRGLNSGDLLNNKGYALYHLGRFEEALLCWEMALRSAPEDITILNNLAAGYAALNHDEEALQYYRRALEICPDDAALHNNLAHFLDELGRVDEALSYYERAVEIDPSNSTYLYNKVACLARHGRHDEAMAVCDRILANHPTNTKLLHLRGDLLTQMGRSDEALDAYNRSLGLTG